MSLFLGSIHTVSEHPVNANSIKHWVLYRYTKDCIHNFAYRVWMDHSIRITSLNQLFIQQS